jgi:hypothetical protein
MGIPAMRAGAVIPFNIPLKKASAVILFIAPGIKAHDKGYIVPCHVLLQILVFISDAHFDFSAHNVCLHEYPGAETSVNHPYHRVEHASDKKGDLNGVPKHGCA